MSSSRAESYRTRYLALRSVLHDRNTGLDTFPMLLDRLRAQLDQRRRLGVLHLEIEQLEVVESLYGWQELDRILRHVAEVLRVWSDELPDGSSVALDAVAGERFGVFVPEQPRGEEVDGTYLSGLRRELRDRLAEVFSGDAFASLSPTLDFRVGHAFLSLNPFYRFERRVYGALDEARTFDRQRRDRREKTWGDELRRTIEDGAIRPVFQPVVDLQSRDILGHEAFARGPKDSPFEMPNAMFALSKRIGLIADLDRVCCETALRAVAALPEQGKLFLNVLPFCLETVAVEERFEQLLDSVGLARGDIVLEFSERFADEPDGAFAERIARVKARGFGVALDDIGTGYGSQAILEDVRPDYLKLDGSLVRGIDGNLIKQELLSTLIRIAERIDAVVIAEGVETAGEARTLAEAGTRYGQGYLFAAPAPAGRVQRAREGDA
ncbi:MAG: GGDEF domain-containing protein [bacterium]|nr:GGDEF domain-containing protein [bacterium]